MGKRLYVGNMSYSVDNAVLRELFEPHGTVESAEVVNDRATGRSKGFGFVEMANEDEAQAAMTAVQGKRQIRQRHEDHPVEDDRVPVNHAQHRIPSRALLCVVIRAGRARRS